MHFGRGLRFRLAHLLVPEWKEFMLADRPLVGINFWCDRFTADGRFITRDAICHNLMPDAGLNLIRDLLNGTAAAGAQVFALGTATQGTPLQGDTALAGEAYRDWITARITGNKQLTLKYYLPSNLGNGNTYTWAGAFGGGASLTANSGVLLAETSFAGMLKTTAEQWTFSWVFSFASASAT